ncbi:MYND finger domain-containing protein [Hirsutella rhossiliensis]
MATSTVDSNAKSVPSNSYAATALPVITGANRAGEDAEYKEQFAQAMMPLMKEHESACRSASGLSANAAGARIIVWVTSLCGSGQCEVEMRQEMQLMMGEMRQEHETRHVVQSMRDDRGLAYCGKEHQKADWKVHKKACRGKVWKGMTTRSEVVDGVL